MIKSSDIPSEDLIEITWDEPYVPTLPMIDPSKRKHGLMNTIRPEPLVNKMLDSRIIIIDCRFDYEF